jgi:hypothetical protein
MHMHQLVNGKYEKFLMESWKKQALSKDMVYLIEESFLQLFGK